MFVDQRVRSVYRAAGVLFAWLLAAGIVQAMPAIQHWTTENGAQVYFVPSPELPMMDVRVVFAAGSARDAALPGLAGLTNGLLDKGAAGLSATSVSAISVPGATPSAVIVCSSTPAARPRQPACATATHEPSSAANRTGRQSAVMIASTVPRLVVKAASAGPLS